MVFILPAFWGVRTSLMAQFVNNPPSMQGRPQLESWVRKIVWRRDGLPTPSFLGFACGSAGKESAYNARDLGSIPGLGRSPGEGNGNPHQYSCLKNPMDGGAWWATFRGVARSQTRLSDFTFTFSSEPHSVKTLHCDPSILGGPTRHGL